MSIWFAGAALVGSVVSAKGSKDAGKTQAAASDRASEVQREMYDDTKETLTPYIDAGRPAMDRQQALLGLQGRDAQQGAFDDFTTSPAADWQRDQTIGAISRSGSAGGMVNSGNRLAALTDRLQGLYSQEYNNYFNQLGSQSSIGLSAANALGGVSTASGAGQAATIQNAGNARAQGQLGVASSIGSGLADIAGIYQNRQSQKPPATIDYNPIGTYGD